MTKRVVLSIAVCGAVFLLAGIGYIVLLNSFPYEEEKPVAEATEKQVHKLCAYCHKYPPPDSFPKSAWKKEVEQGYDFLLDDRRAKDPHDSMADLLPMESILKYYENRAPEELPLPVVETARGKPPVRFQREGHGIPGQPIPAVSNVNLVHLFDDKKLDVLVCDMRDGWITAFSPYQKGQAPRVLGRVDHPAHAEVVDLYGDGSKDILVADLGDFYPTNDRVGKLVLLRNLGGGKFTPITLLDNVGRVADVQAGDFKGTGKKDLIVAVFGWRTTGEILYLENQTTDKSRPMFKSRVLDERHGTIHVPVADINKDGKLDFVALISQEHETVVAFLGDGKGNFQKKEIYTGPHPAYGSSGIQLVDLNNDGRIDVLYTNGDVMDSGLLKPYHSIQWLENKGSFPFTHHHITSLYGAHRAVAADFEGKGLPDIVAVSCLPVELYKQEPKERGLDAVILLKQTSPGKFARYALEKGSCDHVTCAVGDLDASGKLDLVTGNFYLLPEQAQSKEAITIWWNQSLPRGGKGK